MNDLSFSRRQALGALSAGVATVALALKVVEDGTMLRSQANLVASRAAKWGARELETARLMFDRIAAQRRAVSRAATS